MLERGRETELVRCRPVPAWFQESLRDVSWGLFQERLGIGFFCVFFPAGARKYKNREKFHVPVCITQDSRLENIAYRQS